MNATIKTAGLLIDLHTLEKNGLKCGDNVSIEKYHPPVSDKQRALWFAYLNWCLKNGLRDFGHFSAEGLHEDIKAWFKDSRLCHEFPVISVSRKGMTRERFEEFIKITDREIMNWFFCINTAGWWEQYETLSADTWTD